MMRRFGKTAGFLLVFLLLFSGMRTGTAKADLSLKETAEKFLEMVGRQFLFAAWEEYDRRFPVPDLIDRWTNPDAYPGFSFPEDTDLLEIWIPKLYDRDAAIILYQNSVWMIDCADEMAEQRVVPLMKKLGITHVDRLFNTHPHYDHLNGLYTVHESIGVDTLMICFPEDINEHMIRAVEYAREQGIAIEQYEDEDDFAMGDGAVLFHVWMKTNDPEDLNQSSAQIMVTYGARSMLFAADMDGRGQPALVAAVEDGELKADILKYPHHGKKPLWEVFYNAVRPKAAVITNTMGTRVCRGGQEYLGWKRVPALFATKGEGTIRLTTDGRTWLCESVIP